MLHQCGLTAAETNNVARNAKMYACKNETNNSSMPIAI